MINKDGMDVTVFVTNGQSFRELATQYTLSPEYAEGIANFNNMGVDDITGKRFRVEIPTSWLKTTGEAGGTVQLPPSGNAMKELVPGVPNFVTFGALGLLTVWALTR